MGLTLLARTLWEDNSALTTVEYALLLAVFVVAAVATLSDMACQARSTIRIAGFCFDIAQHTHPR